LDGIVMVSADQELLDATAREGLEILNPMIAKETRS
jgi:hypothetical protein